MILSLYGSAFDGIQLPNGSAAAPAMHIERPVSELKPSYVDFI